MARKKDNEDKPLHEQLPPVSFTAMGAEDSQKDQGNLIAAKQSEAFPVAGGLVAHGLTKFAERIMLDYTQSAVAVKYEVDGLWMNIEPRDRQSGDAILQVLKKISGLDPNERRTRQAGKFGAEFHGRKYICEITTQGVKTGERVLIKLNPKGDKFDTIEELGMREKMREQFKSLIDQEKGMVVFSALPGNGLTTLWKIGLSTADRFVRDFVSLEDESNPEEEVINVGPIFYDAEAGQSPADILPKLLLKQPDVFCVPNLTNGDTVKILCEQVHTHGKMVVTRTPAKDSIDALMRIFALKGPQKEVAQALTMVVNARLIRKLCDACKQAYQPNPQLLQKLGIPPGRVQKLYKEFELPPPEQRVDEKGRPIEYEPCKECNGVGYRGRTAIFELLVVDDKMRQSLAEGPNPDVVRKLAKQAQNRTLQEEGILLVAQGTTSLPELQRVLKQ